MTERSPRHPRLLRPAPSGLLAMTVGDALQAVGLLDPHLTLLIGVSGGTDSVCLLHLFTQVEDRLRLRVAHLDRGLGEKSAADASSVAELCGEGGVPATVERRDVRQARKTGSLEDAARRTRYGFFAEVAAAIGAAAVA